MLKVIGLTSSFPLKEGDLSGIHVYELAYGLAKKGDMDAIIIAPHSNGAPFLETRSNMKIFRFPYFFPFRFQKLAYFNGLPYQIKISTLAKIQLPLFILSQFLTGFFVINKYHINLLYSHWLIPQGLIGAVLRRTIGVPHVAIIHSSEITILKKIPLGKLLCEFIIDHSDSIVSVSSHRYLELATFVSPDSRKKLESKIHIVSMGVDLSTFQVKEDMVELRKKYRIPNKFIILFVGRLVEVKGVEYLLQGFKEVSNERKDVQLIIVGGGELETKLKNMACSLGIEDSTRFVGSLPHETVTEYYKLADIIVFPSIVDSSGYEEGLPKVLMEALASGKPVIASQIKGNMEVIQHKYNGLIVNQKDSNDIAEKILFLLNNPQIIANLSENALKSAKNYGWDVITERYHTILNNVGQLHD